MSLTIDAERLCDSSTVQKYCRDNYLKVRLRRLDDGKIHSCLVSEGGKIMSPLFEQTYDLIRWVFRQGDSILVDLPWTT